MRVFIGIEGENKEARDFLVSIVHDFFQKQRPTIVHDTQFGHFSTEEPILQSCYKLIHCLHYYQATQASFFIGNGTFLSLWYQYVMQKELEIQKKLDLPHLQLLDHQSDFFRGIMNAYFDLFQSFQSFFIILDQGKNEEFVHACANPFSSFVISFRELHELKEKAQPILNQINSALKTQ